VGGLPASAAVLVDGLEVACDADAIINYQL